jgi:hypothetical protein
MHMNMSSSGSLKCGKAASIVRGSLTCGINLIASWMIVHNVVFIFFHYVHWSYQILIRFS